MKQINKVFFLILTSLMMLTSCNNQERTQYDFVDTPIEEQISQINDTFKTETTTILYSEDYNDYKKSIDTFSKDEGLSTFVLKEIDLYKGVYDNHCYQLCDIKYDDKESFYCSKSKQSLADPAIKDVYHIGYWTAKHGYTGLPTYNYTVVSKFKLFNKDDYDDLTLTYKVGNLEIHSLCIAEGRLAYYNCPIVNIYLNEDELIGQVEFKSYTFPGVLSKEYCINNVKKRLVKINL